MLSEPSYPQHPGGAGKCAHLLAAGLVRRGHRVHLVCRTGGEAVRERIDGVRVHRLPEPRGPHAPSERTEAATAREFLDYLTRRVPLGGIDVIHDASGFLSYFFPVELELKRRLGVPLVVQFQLLLAGYLRACRPDPVPFSDASLAPEATVRETVQCFAARLADLIVCLSEDEVALAQRLFRPEGGRVASLPCPVDVERLVAKGGAIPELAGGGARGPRVLFAGRIGDPMKGADVVLRAFRRVLRARPDARLVVLTSDRAALSRFDELGDTVVRLDWVAEPERLAAIYGAVDVAVLPSRYEPFGMLCLELLAAGVPVIAAPTGGLREMVGHGENGLLLGHDRRAWDAELAQGIVALVSNPALVRRMRAVARRRAAERYALPIVAERLERLYDTARGRFDQAPSHAVRAPILRPADRRRYLALLEELAGPAARRLGDGALADLPSSIEERCGRCSRARLATDAARLTAVGAERESADGRRLEEAVTSACPLGLLQRAWLAPERARRGAAGARASRRS